MIYEQRTYVSDAGQVVFGRVPIDGSIPMEFSANFVFAFNIQTPQGMQQVQSTVPMPIEAESVERAFEMLPDVAEQAKEKAAADMKAKLDAASRPQIALPGAPPPGSNGQRLRITG